MKIKSYAYGEWFDGNSDGVTLYDATDNSSIGTISSEGLDYKAMLEYGRNIGGKNLRKYTFHERAVMLKELAKYLLSKKEGLYEISYRTGATKTDSWIDIEGGVGTLFTYSGKGRRELPNEKFYLEGKPEILSRNGSFIGHHICVPLKGVALHINAFNFPCWGMLEKLSPTILAGVPAIVKPASATAYLAEAMVSEIIESGILPEGSIQLISGGVGDIFDHLTHQDSVTFTGSASTGKKLKSHPNILNNSIRFNLEADSINCSVLGIDAEPDTDEFNLFVKEVVREMTVKAGQKCTAIRRAIVPQNLTDAVIDAINLRLTKVAVGNPRFENVRMGPLVSKTQVNEVRERVLELMTEAELVSPEQSDIHLVNGDWSQGAFFPPTLLYCETPLNKTISHSIEAFGPVSTIMPYNNTDEAIELANKGEGSLVASLFTNDNKIAKQFFFGAASHHGRIMLINRNSAAESTGHGSPMPQLVHGGPGRAGGGEELGGIRSVLHYMQRTAIQGHPTTLSYIGNQWLKGAEKREDVIHPFKKYFEELKIGDTLITHKRTVTETDIVNFANISGDNFYAHVDITSLTGSIFESRVAHGYFIISAAAGLFVDPKKGPVLANYGLDELRFTQPVYVNDTIYVNLTVKEKIDKENREGQIPQGIVKWDVEVINQREELVAQATILTLVAKKE